MNSEFKAVVFCVSGRPLPFPGATRAFAGPDQGAAFVFVGYTMSNIDRRG